MDTPQLTPQLLASAWPAADAAGADAVLGPSADGGFWAVGLRRPCPAAFPGVPMSTPHTFAAQLARLRSLGLRVHLLPELRDVDTPADAAVVAALAPHTRFARLHRHLTGPPSRPVSPLELYGAALQGRPVSVELADGRRLPLDVGRWADAPDGIDRLMLSRCEGAVLDLGCGPGRLVGALAEAGRPALGVDISAGAVRLTAERGASVLCRSVQGRLPAEGRWDTVLLADGNIGIGGDPAALLRRCQVLLRPGGLLLAETDPCDDLDDRSPVTLVDARGRRSHPLPWARLGRAALAELGWRTGYRVAEEWRADPRAFLALRTL
jgi:SAM-dependent methyltransferase